MTLNPRKTRLVLSLLTHDTVEAAAKAASVPLRTAMGWLHGDPAFARALAVQRGRVLAGAANLLTAAATDAARALRDIATGEESVFARLQAANMILSHASRFAELADLEARLTELEARAERDAADRTSSSGGLPS
jgi:hypothetical protein